MKISEKEKVILEGLIEESKLNADSLLYRYTSEKYLKTIDDDKEVLITRDDPVEMITDQYHGQGHVYLASDIGPGLSFLTEPLDEYEKEGRVCVSVKLKDLLAQGGLMYKVTSLPAYITAYFFTLPSGRIEVER